MTKDLTEQWKNGELPEGYYYVRDGNNMIAEYLDGYFYNDGEPMTSFSGGVDEVLAEVPSYDEWKQLHKFLEEFNALEVAEENAKLKELLKECREVAEFTKTIVNKHKWFNEVITKIDEVLK